MSRPAVEMIGVVKRFAHVVANDHASFEARAGEIHALVGENGAGKSTLMRILYGLLPADRGAIRVEGRELRLRSPRDAIAAGIGMVHQHFMLVATMTAGENVILGREPTERGLIALERANQRLLEISERHQLTVDPRALVRDLGVGARQRVEILKALFRGARVLILDEPTAVLTPHECKGFFGVLRALRDEGSTVILITHRLDEVGEVADRVTVMRGGRTIAVHDARTVGVTELAAEMVGHDLPDERVRPLGMVRGEGAPAARVPDALRLDAVTVDDDRGLPALREVTLRVRPGEIVGVAGVAGNGQRELVEVAAGLRSPSAGRVVVGGLDLTGEGRRAFLDRGVAYVPEDRLDRGVVRGFTVAENLALGRHRHHPIGGRIRLHRRAMAERARSAIASHDIRAADPDLPAQNLSGGNQQKLVVARELGDGPRLLVAAEPTRGVDIGAIRFIHGMLRDACEAGAGVLLVSSELAELLALANRLLVLYRGRIVHESAGETATREEIGGWMLGGRGPELPA